MHVGVCLVWDLDPEGIGAEPNKKKKTLRRGKDLEIIYRVVI